jgi:hypothetical protein
MAADDPHTWTRLQPGVYDDNDGGLHLVIGELLAANGYADTPENRTTIIEAARIVFGHHVDADRLVIEE